MASKFQFITELYRATLAELTGDYESWTGFLRAACYNYKCPFDEQVLIYAQRPNATAVLELEKWNRQFGRWVNAGATGIAVIDEAHGKGRLKHYSEIVDAMQSATDIPSFAATSSRWCDTIELVKDSSGNYSASVTDTNGVLSDFNFSSNSGNGITFTQRGNTLTITATPEAAKGLSTEKTYSATGSAYGIDPDEAVLCWYDSTGKYQSLASYTGTGLDPVRAYIKIKATVTEEKGSLTINKTDADTGKALAGVIYRLYDSAGNKIADAITGTDGKAVFADLPLGSYSYQEISAPEGYVVDETKYQITITAETLNITETRTNTMVKGSLIVRKVDVTGSPLAGAELLLETSADGQIWTEVSRITTDKTGIANWDDLKIGAQYRIIEVKAPAGYILMTEPVFTGTLDSSNPEVTITACNSTGFVLPFTGGVGFTTYFLFAALMLCMGVYFYKKSNIKENN